MSSGASLTMMPTDQMFIDRDIKNPIVQVNQDTILKAAQLSNLPGKGTMSWPRYVTPVCAIYPMVAEVITSDIMIYNLLKNSSALFNAHKLHLIPKKS